jgi:tRNA A-37 threonylcarbamoyl transferase component Bud32
MTPENIFENETRDYSDISLINDVLRDKDIRTESSERILSIREFDPKTDKGIYIAGENHHSIHQAVITVQRGRIAEEVEVFAKCIKDPEKANTEKDAYRRCQDTGIQSLLLLSSIETPIGTFNLTKTENYLIPYSRLKITNIHQYMSMRGNAIHAINRIHNIGIHHRDILTRNIAVLSNSPFQTIVFDFESSQVYPYGSSLSEEQKKQDIELFTQSLFFQLVKQNPNNKNLVSEAEKLNL